MQIDGVEIIKLSAGRTPPSDSDLLAEVKHERSGGWTAKIVAGLLFIETVPGTHMSLEAALGATVKLISQSRTPSKLFYRTADGPKRVIKKTRYVRA